MKKLVNINRFIKEIGNINRYMLLSRMQCDCEYFLGWGNGHEKHLWALDVKLHIKYMKYLYLLFPINDKPEWISMKDILNYEKKMKTPTLTNN